jgi:tetratricopeptide (TPR) repeat protein
VKSGLCLSSILCSLVAAAWGADAKAAPTPKPTAEQIARWVGQLGDNEFRLREAASRQLWGAGELAEAALREAARSEDIEVARRAKEILDKFKWGIYPDTPKEIVELIGIYRDAEVPQKLEVVPKLLAAGTPGSKAIRKLLAVEKDLGVKRQVFNKVAENYPLLIASDNRAALEPRLEIGLELPGEGVASYAAYWLLRGKLDERIGSFEGMVKQAEPYKTAMVLAYLYRARGDLPAARRAAEKAAQAAEDTAKEEARELVRDVLFAAADWKELARLPEPDNSTPIYAKCEHWSFRAAFQHRAGNDKEFEAALAQLRKLDEEPGLLPPVRMHTAYLGAKACFLNDRPAEALELLTRSDHLTLHFNVLCAQHKYADALTLVEKSLGNLKELGALEDLQAHTLYLLGEKDKAQAIFARRAAAIKDGPNPEIFASLIDAEHRAGLQDQALAHCARLLPPLEQPGGNLLRPQVRLLFDKVFPGKTDAAVVWWVFLRQKYHEEEISHLLHRLHALLAGKTPAAEVKALVEEAERATLNAVVEADQRLAALAEVAHAAGLDDLACSCLEKALAALPKPAPGTAPDAVQKKRAAILLRLGDLLAERKQWPRAAERYRQAWEGDRREPLPLFLAGWALDRAGKADEGKKLMEQSHWLPLGDETSRYTFFVELSQRRHREASLREADLLARLGNPFSHRTGNALRRLALQAAARKDYATAARDYDLAMLGILRSSAYFVQDMGYVSVPGQVHRLRAAAELTAGRIDAARREIALAQAVQPGNVDLAIGLVPLLERAGSRKDADRLFADTLAVHEKLCRDYPRCASAHNSAAWVSACCRRNLDAALTHAARAVELAPDTPAYLDTLAEVHFQRGEKDKAVAVQKKVIELDPKKPYYRKQLRRLEAGDPAAERPMEDVD